MAVDVDVGQGGVCAALAAAVDAERRRCRRDIVVVVHVGRSTLYLLANPVCLLAASSFLRFLSAVMKNCLICCYCLLNNKSIDRSCR
jgi:hypothetical protein